MHLNASAGNGHFVSASMCWYGIWTSSACVTVPILRWQLRNILRTCACHRACNWSWRASLSYAVFPSHSGEIDCPTYGGFRQSGDLEHFNGNLLHPYHTPSFTNGRLSTWFDVIHVRLTWRRVLTKLPHLKMQLKKNQWPNSNKA